MYAIPFVKIADVPAFPDEYELVTQSVAGDGALLFLFVESSGREAVYGKEVTGGGARFARTRMDEPMRFRLVKATEGERAIVDLPPLDVAFPVVDVFPDGRVLVAGTRCAWYAEGDFDLNGIVFDPATGACERILLGDGIARLSIDQSSRIWVGYYDEGIYGISDGAIPGRCQSVQRASHVSTHAARNCGSSRTPASMSAMRSASRGRRRLCISTPHFPSAGYQATSAWRAGRRN